MNDLSPGWVLGIGFVLVVFGAVAPFLMVMKIIEPTFLLSFLAYAAQVSGVILGLIGGMSYIRRHRK
jgi:hypothetical protein